MNEAEFCSHLQTVCATAIEDYRMRFPTQPPLSQRLPRDTDSALASTADIETCFTALVAFYDSLLGVDSTPYRDQWRDHLVYDFSLRERLTLLGSDLPASLTLFMIAGRYAAHTGYIGISGGRLPIARAGEMLASELCHAYQHRFDSPTWHHPYLQEGFELAASIRALTYLADELDDETMAHRARRQRTRALLQGTIAHGIRNGGITAATVRTLGVTDHELSELRAALPVRLLGTIRPRYHWGSTAFLPEYDLFGSLLLVSEALDIPDTYSRAFWGKHPWDELIAEIQSTRPSWLWQRYHTSGE
ncbi:hypothetical protein [Haloarcula amylovorans]|uniref:hypothetical protein n=1 Tax=Haloarcula amylovorans TaxID=2562280 RepID=UPI001075D12F|nr:hypothetical protein [Halomicroarcula amylolytica]